MIFAIDKNKKRVHINQTHVNYDYFCPICGEKLVLRKGEIRRHHFAHHPSTKCTDFWHYDMSDWHQDWQDRFPLECQEVVMEHNGIKHRADVFINNTVIEFQHSPLSSEEFDDRNNFYTGLGYKVVWIFDLTAEYEEGKIYESDKKTSILVWKHPRRTFKNFDLKNKKVSLFFELGTAEDDGVVEPWVTKVTWATPDGFERFAVDEYGYRASDFFEKTDEKKTYTREDIYNDMYNDHNIGTIGHGHIFHGCPLSSSGFASNNSIDHVDEKYGKCYECPHTFDYWKCKYAADYLKIPDDAKIIEIKRNQFNLISSVIYEVDGKKIEGKLPDKDYGANTLPNLWEMLENPSIATFKNLETGIYVRITRSPREQYKKWGKVYGKFSGDQYTFSKDKEASKEIYNWNKPIWWCVWHN